MKGNQVSFVAFGPKVPPGGGLGGSGDLLLTYRWIGLAFVLNVVMISSEYAYFIDCCDHYVWEWLGT